MFNNKLVLQKFAHTVFFQICPKQKQPEKYTSNPKTCSKSNHKQQCTTIPPHVNSKTNSEYKRQLPPHNFERAKVHKRTQNENTKAPKKLNKNIAPQHLPAKSIHQQKQIGQCALKEQSTASRGISFTTCTLPLLRSTMRS